MKSKRLVIRISRLLLKELRMPERWRLIDPNRLHDAMLLPDNIEVRGITETDEDFERDTLSVGLMGDGLPETTLTEDMQRCPSGTILYRMVDGKPEIESFRVYPAPTPRPWPDVIAEINASFKSEPVTA